jgi:hypothetical protein
MINFADNKGFKRCIALLLSLSAILPAQLVFALSDCGEHEIVSCETHDDHHFVAKHVLETSTTTKTALVSDSEPEEEHHDTDHEIDKDQTGSFFASLSSFEFEKPFRVAPVPIFEGISFAFLRSIGWANAPPGNSKSYLVLLASVRLIV